MNETSHLNSQVEDAVAQINATLGGLDRSFITAAAYQTIAHAITLGLQNAVAQQQQAYTLRNALTTAAASAILEGKREDAEAIMKLAESRMASPSPSADIKDLLTALIAVGDELRKWNHNPAQAPPPAGEEPKTEPA